MNNQEFFDKAVTHLREQQVKATDLISCYGGCSYTIVVAGRTLHCGVGGTMTQTVLDAVVQAGLNSGAIDYVIKELPEAFELYQCVDRQLLVDTQSLHDGVEPANWEGELLALAARYNLEFTAS
jgi:hypothetical protein